MSSETSSSRGSIALSVCMIVKNEAELLGRCLASVSAAADQIIVVDTGSTDATCDVARKFGAQVYESPWRDDFSFSRNVSLDHATGKWILWLDADDVVPEASIARLVELRGREADRVYGFIVRNERPGNTGSEFTQARMFPNRPELRFERRIHEQIMPSALRAGLSLELCDVVIEHHGYADPDQLRLKARRNVRLLLEEYPEVAPDAVMAAEIADSWQLLENMDESAKWYRTLLSIPECEQSAPVLAGHAYYGLGTIANHKGDYTGAIDLFEHAFGLSPWRSDILFGLAVAQELANRPEAALESLARIPSLRPQAGQVGVDFRSAAIKSYLRRLRLLIELDRPDDACRVAQEAVSSVGFRPEIHIMAAKVYLKLGRLMDALHGFENSLHIRREGNLDAYIGLCLVYRAANRAEVLKVTLDAIRPVFGEDPRFIAAESLLLVSEECPVGDPEQIKKLRNEFFEVF